MADETLPPARTAADWAALGLSGPLSAADVEEAAAAVRDTDDPRARVAALGALVRGSAGPTVENAWAVAVRDTDESVRRRAAELCLHLGNPLRADLVDLLDDSDPLVAETAAWAIGELGARGAPAVEALSRVASDHRDPRVREAAVAALGAVGDTRGLPAILAATRDKPTVRRRAVIALAPFVGPEVDEALARAEADRDWQVRDAARAIAHDR